VSVTKDVPTAAKSSASINSKTTTIVETDTTEPTSSAKSTNHLSTQKQLIVLAKKFALEGALISLDKQTPIEDRAIKRERLAHLRKQQNIESIVKRTLTYCSDTDIADRVDQDWFDNFVTLAEGISNKTMQDLWAKILAHEIAQAGSFSHKTLIAFKTMGMQEAKLLAKVCSLSVKDNSKKNIRIISGVYQKPNLINFFDKKRHQKLNLGDFGLNYTELLALAENNLIFIQETESSLLAKNEQLHFSFNGTGLTLVTKKANCILSFYKLTPIGTELASMISDVADDKYLQSLKQLLNYHFSIQT